MPVASTARSPNRLTNRPPGRPVARRMNANADTTAPTAALPTPNSLAKTGMAGDWMPKPTATVNATAVRILTSRGSSRNTPT